jgi:hypothetical protein
MLGSAQCCRACTGFREQSIERTTMIQKKHPWKTLSSHQVINTPYLKVRCEQVALPNGLVIPDYYIIENFGWVGVVPVTEEGFSSIVNINMVSVWKF